MGLLAVILAAGSSTRLRPLTDRTPKCLLDIEGRPIIDRLLEALAAAGLRETVIVTGYLAERIDAHLAHVPPPLRVRLVRNDAYATTNNAASLLVAQPLIGGEDFVLCDGDVVFSASPLPALLASRESCALAVDPTSTDDEAMKVALGPDQLVKRISKQLSAAVSAGESIGVQKVGGEGLRLLWDVLAEVVVRDGAHAYYEEAFQQLIDCGIRFGTSPVVPGTWTEIDRPMDLEAAICLLHGR